MSIFPISLLLFFFKKKYAYTVVYVLEILAFCIVNHTLPFLKSRSSKKIKERKSRELSNAIHIKMCEIVLLIGNTQDINDSKYQYICRNMLHGSDLQICQTHSGLKWGKRVQKEIAWILDRPRQTVWIYFHCTFFQILKSLCNIRDV